jgi:hypothetical protein
MNFDIMAREKLVSFVGLEPFSNEGALTEMLLE